MDWLQSLLICLVTTGALPLAMATANTCLTCCQAAVCNHCSGSAATNTIQVDVSGVTNATCLSCSSLDGTYVLTELNLPHSSGNDACVWFFNMPDVCVTPNNFTGCTASITGPADPGGLNDILTFNFTGDSGTATWIGWTATGAGYDNCAGWSAFNLPYDGTNYMPGVLCDNSAATCTITAL